MNEKKMKKKRSKLKRQIYYSPYWLDPYLFDDRHYDILSPILEESPYLSPEKIISLDISTEWKVVFLLSRELFTKTQLIRLACTFAEHVLTIFEEHTPENISARSCLELMLHYLGGEDTKDALRNEAEKLDDFLMEITHSLSLDHWIGQAGLSILGLESLLEEDEHFQEHLIEVAESAQKAADFYHQDANCNSRQSNAPLEENPVGGNKSEAEWQLERIIELLNSE